MQRSHYDCIVQMTRVTIFLHQQSFGVGIKFEGIQFDTKLHYAYGI